MTTVPFVDYYGNPPERGWPTFSSCCGSRYVFPGNNFSRPMRGIKVGVGALIDNKINPKTSHHLVQTKNGPLSVVIRHKW